MLSFDPATGEPVAGPSSTTALSDIISNPNNTACPGQCFRPAGLAWDAQGRLWMTSDTTGEIYVLKKTSASTPTATSSGSIVTSTNAPSAAGLVSANGLFYGAVAAFVGLVMTL